jgi:hypothetical protein
MIARVISALLVVTAVFTICLDSAGYHIASIVTVTAMFLLAVVRIAI